MSPARKKTKTIALRRPKTLARFLTMMLGPGRPVVLAAAAAAVLLGAWYLVWRQVRHNVLSSNSYLLATEDVRITALPDWIHSDIRSEVFNSASLDGSLSIMDDDLAQRVANAFSLHPWIARVVRVTKSHPARVEVELIYRRPVCMVEVPNGLFPVDEHGVLLPVDDFSPVEASRYPQLVGIDTAPLGTIGESWGDGRVLGAAEIAAALGPAWHEFKLRQMVASPTGIAEEHIYTLITRGGTRVRWGLPPGTKAPGELPPAEKLARLRNYMEKNGTLEGRDGPQELDLHDLQTPRVSSRRRR